MSGAVGGECDVWRGIAESGYMPGSAVYALRVALAGPPFGATGQHFDVSLAMARASVAHASAVLVRKRIAADTNLAGKLLSTCLNMQGVYLAGGCALASVFGTACNDVDIFVEAGAAGAAVETLVADGAYAIAGPLYETPGIRVVYRIYGRSGLHGVDVVEAHGGVHAVSPVQEFDINLCRVAISLKEGVLFVGPGRCRRCCQPTVVAAPGAALLQGNCGRLPTARVSTAGALAGCFSVARHGRLRGRVLRYMQRGFPFLPQRHVSNEDTGSNVTLSVDTDTIADLGAPECAPTLHAAMVGYAERRCLQAHVVSVGGRLCGWLTIRLHRTRSSRQPGFYTAAATRMLHRARRDLSSLLLAHGLHHAVIVRIAGAGTTAGEFRSVITGRFISRFMGDDMTLAADEAGGAHWAERVCVTAVNTTVPWEDYGTDDRSEMQGKQHYRMAIRQA